MRNADSDTALVVARHRRRIEIETADGARLSCIASRSLQVLCGDRVLWQREADGTCVATEALPRETVLTRIDSRGRPEPVAANLTQLVAVVASAPAPDWPLLDRYLAAAELMRISAVIVHNKCDLARPPDRLAEYARIGYTLVATSTAGGGGSGLEALAQHLACERSALLGQSGVGKSSLLNALIGESIQRVGELGGRGGHGRHTTTTAVLHRLRGGGELVDTPGVRHYAPYIEHTSDVAHGFREFSAFLGRCRFADCRHRAEPGCAIKGALETGAVSRERYESYLKLAELSDRPTMY